MHAVENKEYNPKQVISIILLLLLLLLVLTNAIAVENKIHGNGMSIKAEPDVHHL